MALFPSIYRAKVTNINGASVTAFVPQVFGDTPITITDFLGPPKVGMGWVFFQGGHPEFPVWAPIVEPPPTTQVAALEARLASLEARIGDTSD